MAIEPDLKQTPENDQGAKRSRLPGPLATLFGLRREIPEVDTFAIVTFLPVPLLILAGIFGGIAAWASLIWIGLCLFMLDEIIARPSPDAPEGSEFPAADTLSVALGGVHFLLLFLGVAALSGFTQLEGSSWIAVLLAFGLFFGQVSNSNAHELIHRSDRRLFLLGKWIYISLLYGHHSSAHRLVHHRFVATPDDPNSAQLGEGYWAFLPRAWIGSFVAGYEMERGRAARLPEPDPSAPLGQRVRALLARIGPYPSYVLGGLWFVMLFGILFGARGALAYLALCAYAQLQILLADYVQHYGLARARRGDGSYEPVDTRHSWDAPHPVTSLWMLNAPRHSDHHAHPGREYPALRLGQLDARQRPILPRSLPAMASLALIPPLWRRVMDKRVKALGQGKSATLRL
ncbi:MAG: alkane 1-monooxygenase [Thioclava sp.]|nr:alkane 1-monooxygenase [Thioclava sp.]MBD3804381.1 alkane 1-monooxygenase [Thioclava sp.]